MQANGNVPLVSLLRAAGALGRLPKELPLETIIDSAMEYVRRLKSACFVSCPFQRGDRATIKGERAREGAREGGGGGGGGAPPNRELRGCFHDPERS